MLKNSYVMDQLLKINLVKAQKMKVSVFLDSTHDQNIGRNTDNRGSLTGKR